MSELRENTVRDIGLPIRPFLYTLDQIGVLLSLNTSRLQVYIHYDGRSVGRPKRDKLLARNIAPLGEAADWRVPESELIRWLRNRGFRVRESRWVRT